MIGVGGLLRGRTRLVEKRARHAHVVGLDGEDAGDVSLLGLVLDQRRGALVPRDADILEEHPAEEEVELVGEGIEVVAEPGRLTDGGETARQIDRRTVDRHVSQALAVVPDVGQLVGGQLLGKLADGVGREGHQAATGDLARLRADVLLAEALAGGPAQVVLRLEVFEIEGEVEDRVVVDLCLSGAIGVIGQRWPAPRRRRRRRSL